VDGAADAAEGIEDAPPGAHEQHKEASPQARSLSQETWAKSHISLRLTAGLHD
jgi:hypothetical protein